MRMKIEENQDFGRGNDCSECSIEICVHCKPDCLGDLHHDENADISRMVTGDCDHDDAGHDYYHDNHHDPHDHDHDEDADGISPLEQPPDLRWSPD